LKKHQLKPLTHWHQTTWLKQLPKFCVYLVPSEKHFILIFPLRTNIKH